MSQVPSSGATMVAEISAVEEFSDHKVKSDGAVVSLSAVITATEQRGFADSDTAQVDAQVTGVDQYGRSDEAVVTMTAVVSGVDGKLWTDAAVASLVAEVSGSDSTTHAYTDAATVSLVAVPQAAESHEIEDFHTAKLVAVISALDEHQFPADAAVVTMVGVPSAVDVNAKWYTDATDVLLVGVPSALDSQHGIEAATVTSVGVPSGIDGQGYSDSATARVVGVPSGVDGKTWSDSGTVTTVGIASDAEEYTEVSSDPLMFGAWHYGGDGSDPAHSALAMSIGGTAAVGDWIVVGSVSSAGFSDFSTPPVVKDNIDTVGTDWVLDVDTNQGGSYGSGGTHVTYWKKECVGGETTVTVAYGGSTNKAAVGIWIPVGTSDPYIIRNTNASWGGTELDWNTGANHAVSNGETYITIALGGGSGASDPSGFAYFTNQGGGWTATETDSLLELATGECWARVGYGDASTASPAHTTADQIILNETVNLPMYVAAYGFHP